MRRSVLAVLAASLAFLEVPPGVHLVDGIEDR